MRGKRRKMCNKTKKMANNSCEKEKHAIFAVVKNT